MSNGWPKKSRHEEPEPLKARGLRGAKYLRNILRLLKRLRPHEDCPNRRLHYDEYTAYLLLYFFNPVLTSMRALQQASDIDALPRKFGLPRFSLGSFSEASRVFDPTLLQPIIGKLAGELSPLPGNPRLRALGFALTAVDGTLLDALPKMLWALWLSPEQRAAKMHLEFDILKGAPILATVTDGNGNERQVLRDHLAAGKLYVLDGGYVDYGLAAAMLAVRSSFVLRLHGNAVYQVLEDRPLTPAAQRAGVRRDLVIRLGGPETPDLHGHALRLVEVHIPAPAPRPGLHRKGRPDRKTKLVRTPGGEETLLLLTDLLGLEAELIAEIYRSRWQIEIFFRWFKKILHADHLLSLCENGVTLVAYCALIASLLVTLWTGRKPTKRTYELICFYFLGRIDEDQLAARLEKLEPAKA
jgi:hypothetical protein